MSDIVTRLRILRQRVKDRAAVGPPGWAEQVCYDAISEIERRREAQKDDVRMSDDLIERLRQIADHDWRVSFLAHTSDTAKEAADIIERLRAPPAGDDLVEMAAKVLHEYDAIEPEIPWEETTKSHKNYIRGAAHIVLSAITPAIEARGWARGIEEAAKVAEAERLTGVPPIGQWSADMIEIAQATVWTTAQSIAAAIRALATKEPPHDR
jgi:hypothetical protein